MNRLLGLPLNNVRTIVKSKVLQLTEYLEQVSSPIVKKCEGTILEKAGIFLKNVAIDYKEVFAETYNRTLSNPLKMSIYIGALGFGACCAALNPDETSFRNQLLLNQHKLMMLAEPIRNPVPAQKVKELEKYYNQGQIHIFSFGIASFMWINDHDDRTALFEAQCDYLAPSMFSYPSRVVDFGFFGKWWLLSRYMVDYDINPEEFSD